ncbi:protein of unknown function DUF1470 [Catenulispora acidiphila DSM 44928]|uniref:Zinc finger CGNR domain-containing protein n=1 Tax=Catenulispora acidiphila (strain DSM 44928 / JCM 14897 / NBRC 102108 / NRRL B-24433 / ID139908) TaxID=479433 RepID=C7QK29_CATAD|nr:ABATE domain-containing protein [Catenulispora acidiphila]ACU75103.1 protein of unknown function DUF1470 [Catenulispora acidiphila DSM 44928]
MTEPLAVAFANTWYAVRGDEREGVGTPLDLAKWLDSQRLSAGVGEGGVGGGDVREFLTLRDAIRALLRATTEGEALPEAAKATLNTASEQAPSWPALAGSADSGYGVIEVSSADPLSAARARIARDAIAVLGGPLREDVRACHAPGCVQYFVKDHPRREWCSAACGNRARVARHYLKSKDS